MPNCGHAALERDRVDGAKVWYKCPVCDYEIWVTDSIARNGDPVLIRMHLAVTEQA